MSDPDIFHRVVVPATLGEPVAERLRRHWQHAPGVTVTVAADREHALPQLDDPRVTVAEAPLELPLPLTLRLRGVHRQLRCFVVRSLPRDVADEREARSALTRLRAGDRTAIATLHERWFVRAYLYARTFTETQAAAQTGAQAVFLRVLERAGTAPTGLPFRTWIAALVHEQVGVEATLTALVEHAPSGAIAQRIADDADAAGPVPHNAAAADALAQRIDLLGSTDVVMLIGRLPLAERRIALLRHVLRLTAEDTAALLQCSASEIDTAEDRALGLLEHAVVTLERDDQMRVSTLRLHRVSARTLPRGRSARLATC